MLDDALPLLNTEASGRLCDVMTSFDLMTSFDAMTSLWCDDVTSELKVDGARMTTVSSTETLLAFSKSSRAPGVRFTKVKTLLSKSVTFPEKS